MIDVDASRTVATRRTEVSARLMETEKKHTQLEFTAGKYTSFLIMREIENWTSFETFSYLLTNAKTTITLPCNQDTMVQSPFVRGVVVLQ